MNDRIHEGIKNIYSTSNDYTKMTVQHYTEALVNIHIYNNSYISKFP